MKVIGITGKSGSGKSTLTELLAKKLNCQGVNIDHIGHQATNDEKIIEKLCETFGNEILGENQKVNRKKLGNIVFSNKEKMEQLTEITWGYMQKVLDDILKEEPEVILLEWALLPIDSKYWDKCDVKILMKADDRERKRRIMQRDKITEEYFLKREVNSLNYDKYEFNYIFENDYQLETIEKITVIIEEYIDTLL